MKVTVYNQEGGEVGTTILPKEIFEVKMNPDLVHQVTVSQRANRRKIIAHTKNRGEVRGGGRKPWPQKHMGKARHGSIRSPLWRHGGVTFGPRKEKNFKKTIPLKMRRKALFMVLSSKIRNNFLIILDKLKLDVPKTKLMEKIINDMRSKIVSTLSRIPPSGKNFKKGSILIALPEIDRNLILATRNLARVEVRQARELNCLDLLSFKYLIMPKESIKIIKETFLKND